jgi:hypothetical protein
MFTSMVSFDNNGRTIDDISNSLKTLLLGDVNPFVFKLFSNALLNNDKKTIEDVKQSKEYVRNFFLTHDFALELPLNNSALLSNVVYLFQTLDLQTKEEFLKKNIFLVYDSYNCEEFRDITLTILQTLDSETFARFMKVTSENGDSLLSIAAKEADIFLVDYIINRLTNEEVDELLKAKNKYGQTPLHRVPIKNRCCISDDKFVKFFGKEMFLKLLFFSCSDGNTLKDRLLAKDYRDNTPLDNLISVLCGLDSDRILCAKLLNEAYSQMTLNLKQALVEIRDNFGNGILYYLASESPQLIEFWAQEEQPYPNLYSIIVNENNDTLLHIFAQNSKTGYCSIILDDLFESLEDTINLKKILQLKNKKGDSVLFLLIQSNPEMVLEIMQKTETSKINEIFNDWPINANGDTLENLMVAYLNRSSQTEEFGEWYMHNKFYNRLTERPIIELCSDDESSD